MGKNLRWTCPVCGHRVMERNIDQYFPIQVFKMVGLGRARGWRFDPIVDIGIVERIKNKIKALYEQYFVEPQIQVRMPIDPIGITYDGISIPLQTNSRLSLQKNPKTNLNPKLSLNKPISIKTEVKMIG